ncbi:hypothetical protein OJAV_G00235930 [Oryzias javanicus]|uniref:Uncharacterized protein n=1 Tax=Oryzias javanicus TaxID=123683 RepID=A0A437BYI9_ORYJA|nr:hypothetical protein OJAV_G00235930 [Oryzias javanicus]
MMLLRTFTAAVLLSWGLSCAAQCPENVMVSCENLKVLARWDCKGQQPETNFKVKIMTSLQSFHVLYEDITKETWYDLSHVVWKSKYICLSILYVTVTASNVNFGKHLHTELCSKAEPTCTSEVTFPDGEENCVTLEGFLRDENGFCNIQMNQTQKICPSERTQCPENVMVSCENLKVLARWDCKGQQPETNFKVKIMTSFQVLYEDITKETCELWETCGQRIVL